MSFNSSHCSRLAQAAVQREAAPLEKESSQPLEAVTEVTAAEMDLLLKQVPNPHMRPQ